MTTKEKSTTKGEKKKFVVTLKSAGPREKVVAVEAECEIDALNDVDNSKSAGWWIVNIKKD